MPTTKSLRCSRVSQRQIIGERNQTFFSGFRHEIRRNTFFEIRVLSVFGDFKGIFRAENENSMEFVFLNRSKKYGPAAYNRAYCTTLIYNVPLLTYPLPPSCKSCASFAYNKVVVAHGTIRFSRAYEIHLSLSWRHRCSCHNRSWMVRPSAFSL